MAELKCPHCGQPFTVDDAELSSIISQIRDKEFNKDVDKRLVELEANMEEKHQLQLDSLRNEVTLELKEIHDKEIEKLKKQMDKLENDKVKLEADKQKLQGRIDSAESKQEIAVLKAVKEAVSIPVIGNGDITDVYKAKQMLDETGCDLIMIGRGVLGNPWLIEDINNYLDKGIIPNQRTGIEKIDMCIKHIEYLKKIKPDKLVCLEIRSHIAWYLKGLKNSASIKEKVCKLTNSCDIINLLKTYKEDLYGKQ